MQYKSEYCKDRSIRSCLAVVVTRLDSVALDENVAEPDCKHKKSSLCGMCR